MWFDVGLKRYTTALEPVREPSPLWFDVGLKRYTTTQPHTQGFVWLWFDVGLKRYTTFPIRLFRFISCGLM